MLASVALALTATLGFAPSPAAAADWERGTVCFKHTTGAVYQENVYLQAWVDGAWHNIRTDSMRSRGGCITYALVRGYYWRSVAWTRVGRATFQGISNYAYSDGYGSINYGWNWVYQYGSN